MKSDSSSSETISVPNDARPVHVAHLGRNRISRVLWFILGLTFVGLGLIGIVVPGMPTTVFMILAAACFARSSQSFYNWVLSNPLFGRSVRRFREGKGMSMKAKVFALGSMWLFISMSMVIFFHHNAYWIVIGVTGLGLFGSFFILSQPTDQLGGIDEK